MDKESIVDLIIEESIDFNTLIEYKNLNTLKVFNLELSSIDMDAISNLSSLKNLYFIECSIEGIGILADRELQGIYFDSCKLDNILELNNLNIKELFLENMDEIDLNDLSIIRVLESISFTNTKLLNEDKLIYMDKVINLDLYGTGISSIDTLIANDSLKLCVIDEEIYKKNKEVVKHLKERGISVVNDMNQDVENYYDNN